MKKINVADYMVAVPMNGVNQELPYNVKESLAACLFHQGLKLGARDVIAMDKIATKIEDATDHVLLEETEYDKLLNAIETFKGFGKAEVELVQRVFDAEQVEVAEV